jgi:hypothetical protein
MSDMVSQLYRLLVDSILPNLKTIQDSQAEQRLQTERLNRNLDEFRGEMRIRFAEIRSELAACRIQVEDAMVTICDSEAVNANDSDAGSGYKDKKTLIH